ncbi:SDR family oxidoreductase [Candidatus Pacearchaeota archaeon]|nr:MAG: SDR family oxidoreductase [Candidatus Pacearchaeota archaeon]
MKKAVVTGGSRGIGFEIARKLIEKNYRVVICSRNSEDLEKARESLGERCFAFQCDVSDSESLDSFVENVKEIFGEVDVLVNNAGVAVWKNLSEQTDEEIEKQVRINFEGLVKLTRRFLSLMSKEGVIVNIGSGAGKHGHPGLSVYSATKFAVRGFTKSLAGELDKESEGLKVYVVNPGMTATKMTNFRGVSPEKVAQVVMNAIENKYDLESGDDVDVWEFLENSG